MAEVVIFRLMRYFRCRLPQAGAEPALDVSR
jgi:hypothetical protein